MAGTPVPEGTVAASEAGTLPASAADEPHRPALPAPFPSVFSDAGLQAALAADRGESGLQSPACVERRCRSGAERSRALIS